MIVILDYFIEVIVFEIVEIHEHIYNLYNELSSKLIVIGCCNLTVV